MLFKKKKKQNPAVTIAMATIFTSEVGGLAFASFLFYLSFFGYVLLLLFPPGPELLVPFLQSTAYPCSVPLLASPAGL